MKTNDELLEELRDKLISEHELFTIELDQLPDRLIIERAEEIALKDEFVDMFNGVSCDRNQIKALLNETNTLDFLYKDYKNSKGSLYNFLVENAEEGILELTDKYTDKVLNEDKNKKLIEKINDTLDSLDNYDFCYHLKDKYKIDFFEELLVKDMIDDKECARYLYDFFKEIKGNEQLGYLVEIEVFNSEHYDNIDNYILPQLRKVIIERESINRKKDDMER